MMSTEKHRREAARRERTKKKRAAAAEERAERVAVERSVAVRPGEISMNEAAAWPVKDAWIGENHETWKARVQAGISTARDDGRMGCAFFEVDLLTGAISDIRTLAGVVEGNVNAELIRRSSPVPLLYTAPHNVARLVERAMQMAPRDPAAHNELQIIQRFLQPFDPDLYDLDARFGDPAEEEATAVPVRDEGVVATVKRWFGLA